ncbi:uncharacterized protein LOC141665160 [Apium graveolens]|uniref:uncharacterized protein LOC141665160 n=1 Tax=Apium graveolens TaxID=4045 RepID=UPI003D7B0925
MSKRKEITSYFQPKKKQTITCEDEKPYDASIEVTGSWRAYIDLGPYQPVQVYPFSGPENHPRRFQKKRCGSNTFTVKGFNSWRKVNNGKDCAFRCHVGKGDGSNSAHNFVAKCYYNLKNQPCHLEKIVEGHDKSCNANNQDNFLEMLKLLASYNPQVEEIILDKVPKNAKYTSPKIQKELLHVFARKVQDLICDEIDDTKYCLIVDESRDISKREQMTIVVRFVDKSGFVRERFLDLVHVKDTTSLTLKTEICAILSHHNLNVQNIRGQGYDGASNMRGEWNGLQALFLKNCPYAYYIHCLAHQLQLALVAATRERHDELQTNQIAEIEHLKEIEEIQTDMNAPYFDVLKSLCRQGKQKQMVTMEHHYRVEIFTTAIDQQLQELNNRFSEQMTELLILSASLNPKGWLQCELQHYGLDVPAHPDLKNLSTLGDLCHGLVTTGKAVMYPLVDRLLRLVLTLSASTATSERAFSAMKIVKTSFRNRMKDEFLRDYLIVYIEKEIAETISAEKIIDSFYLIKKRRTHFK